MNSGHAMMVRRLVMVGLGLMVFRACAVAWAAEAPVSAAAARQPIALSGMSDVNVRALEQLRRPQWGRDPFVPPTSREVMSGTLALTTILYSQASAVAVINGQVVRAGDDIDGRRVVSIGPDYVILREGEFTRRLEVPRFSVKNLKGTP